MLRSVDPEPSTSAPSVALVVEEVRVRATAYDVTVDFMDMTGGRRLWARRCDVREGVNLDVGDHVVVGDEDADARVALVTALDEDGNLELEVLDGPVEDHRDLLPAASEATAATPNDTARQKRSDEGRTARSTGQHQPDSTSPAAPS